MEKVKRARVEFTCSENTKETMETISRQEARSVASYIKSLILADFKKRGI